MYEFSHDLAGALSPVIVMLAMMMMTGGSGGSSSYAFSGKADDVGFLLLKARAAARKIRRDSETVATVSAVRLETFR